jgi:DsbC/DsbD-like thiol-disulfide interchange protein
MTKFLGFSLTNILRAAPSRVAKFFRISRDEQEKLAQGPRILRILGIGLAVIAFHEVGFAQPSLGPSDTVVWSASTPAQAPKAGSRVTVTLRGAVKDGWHVYGLEQLPDGPTPLRVSLDASDVAAADGAAAGSPVTKLQDPSFNLVTQFYDRDFTVTVPVRIGSHPAAGAQAIALNVRFQTCNGRICQPPKTVRLSVPVSIRANG